jgi:hypothetical protein
MNRKLIVVLALLFPVVCLAGSVQEAQRAVIARKNAGGGAPPAVFDFGGSRTHGAATDTWGANTAIIRPGQAAVGGSTTVNKMCVYSSGASTIKGFLYNVTTSDTDPQGDETLVDYTNSAVLNSGAGWNTLTFPGNITIVNGNHYFEGIVLSTGSATITIYYTDSAVNSKYYSASGMYTNEPDPMPGPTGWATYSRQGDYSFFVTDGSCP